VFHRLSDSEDEEAGAGKRNGAATGHVQLPSNLIMNCTATVLAIKVQKLTYIFGWVNKINLTVFFSITHFAFLL
jgi:hypothetical protein